MKVGLALGGGGALGYAHIGVIKALEEAKIPVDIINGTSIGAVVGGAYALYKDSDKLARVAEKVVASVNLQSFNIFRFSADKGDTLLREFLLNTLSSVVNVRRSILTHKVDKMALEMIFQKYEFKDTKIPFSAISTDLVSWETVVLNEGLLIDGVLPSISIPGIFPPIERPGQLLVDGGILSNIPVSNLFHQGADFVIAVRLVWSTDEQYRNGVDILNHIELMKQHSLELWELDKADFAISIDLPGFNILKFDDYNTAVNIGYQTAQEAIPELKKRMAEHVN